jgi:hypothetical protein
MPTTFDDPLYAHAPYRLLTIDGSDIRTVQNWEGGLANTEPTSVSLPEGFYRVLVPLMRSTAIDVTVCIVRNETTTVQLDGTRRQLPWRGRSEEFVPAPINSELGEIPLGYSLIQDR